jgi:FAD/FMN-containing dehydrogenase
VTDLVYAIEYVDCDGKLISVSEDSTDRNTILALAGSFGAIGIVVSVTLKLTPMVYADVYVEKPSMFSAVPPRDIADVPESLRKHIDIDMSVPALAEVSYVPRSRAPCSESFVVPIANF